MNRLWILLAAALALAWYIQQRDEQFRLEGKKNRDWVFTWVLIIVLIFFCGLRTWGNDTVTYIEIYEHLTPPLEELTEENLPSFSKGIGFAVLTSVLKSLGVSTQNYLMFYAGLTVIPYVWFVRKYSVNFVFGVFLMFATGFYTFSMAAIKQSLAIGICLCALPFALDKKWLWFFLLVGLAALFHPYAIVYLIVPLVMFEPWTKKTAIYTIVFVIAGFMLETLLGTVLDITDMMGAEYTAEEMLGEGVNMFRVLVSFVPMGLAAFYGKSLFKGTGKEVHLIFNLAMINALIMFVGLFGTANYFARLANYFLPAQVIILPWMLHSAHPKDRRWLIPLCVVGYLGYFYYENAIIRPFDTDYTQMSFWKYISDWFFGAVS